MKILSADQYEHLAQQFRELARQDDPSHSEIIDVKAIEDYLELRDKGGILGKLNIRVYFFLHKPSRSIVVVSVDRKERENAPSEGVQSRIRRRKRRTTEILASRSGVSADSESTRVDSDTT